MSSLESRLKELGATSPVDVSSLAPSAPADAARGGGTAPGQQTMRKVSLG